MEIQNDKPNFLNLKRGQLCVVASSKKTRETASLLETSVLDDDWPQQ